MSFYTIFWDVNLDDITIFWDENQVNKQFFFSVKNHNKFSSQNIVISSQNIVISSQNIISEYKRAQNQVALSNYYKTKILRNNYTTFSLLGHRWQA